MTWSCSSSGHALAIGLTLALPGESPSANMPAPSPSLSLPIACDFQRDCSIQKYVDRDAGPGRQDYRCGRITTDGHDGTDLRLRREEDLARDVPVLAAADGRVLRVRDGMADRNVRSLPPDALGDRLAGNAVILDHGLGWVTQYSHLKLNSVAVRPGMRVRRGDVLGFIGMSGNAEFPHLHFEVRKDGTSVDPFLPGAGATCGSGGANLWDKSAAKSLGYRPVEVLRVGFAATAGEVPQRRRLGTPAELPGEAAALILWANSTGVQARDLQLFRIIGPTGQIILQKVFSVRDGGLDWLGYSGVARQGQRWAAGRYVGSYTLKRNGKLLSQQQASVLIK